MIKTLPTIALALTALAVCACGQAEDAQQQAAQVGNMLHLSSPAFTAGSAIPKRFSCQGDKLSPPINWGGMPPKTESLALIVDDPDAPSGIWVHWIVYNLPADAGGLAANADASGLPQDAETGVNGWDKTGYGAICPPSGTHRYRFKLYALDTRLHLDTPHKAAVLDSMQGHILDQAELTGTYEKR